MENIEKDILRAIEDAPNEVTVNQSTSRQSIVLTRDNLVLDVYFKPDLIGYRIHNVDYPQDVFLSDTDLHDLEVHKDIKESMLREIQFILQEYFEGSIHISSKVRSTWYGKKKRQPVITMRLPSGEIVENYLPCVNIVDFGL